MLQAKSPCGCGSGRLPSLFCSTGSGDSDVGSSGPHNVCLLRSHGSRGLSLPDSRVFGTTGSLFLSADVASGHLSRLRILMVSKISRCHGGHTDFVPTQRVVDFDAFFMDGSNL